MRPHTRTPARMGAHTSHHITSHHIHDPRTHDITPHHMHVICLPYTNTPYPPPSPRYRSTHALMKDMQQLSGLNHPNLVRILGINLDVLPSFVVAELCCTSLEALLQLDQQRRPSEGGSSSGAPEPPPPPPPLPLGRMLQLSHDAASGLAALHSVGIIHRRLEPSKVLLDAEGRGKLSDHSLARHMLRSAESMLVAGSGQGWFAFMGPEAFNLALGPIGPQADIYSLALLMWTMLEGRKPWEGMDDMAILYQVGR